MRVGIVSRAGSPCDTDAWEAVRRLGHVPVALDPWARGLEGSQALLLTCGEEEAGRCGALGRLWPLMEEVVAFARRGGPVLGCRGGLGLLLQAGLLPGLLLPSASRRHVERAMELTVENAGSAFTRGYRPQERILLWVEHPEAHYFLEAEALRRLEAQGRVALRYVEQAGAPFRGVAGLLNEQGNVLGMMPHPGRAVEPLPGRADGRRLLESFLS